MESTQRKLPPNPREKTNFLSVCLFAWTIPLFKKGYRKVLQLDDIFQPLKDDRSELLGDRLEVNWKKQQAKSKRPSLIKALIATLWREYALLSFVCTFNDIVLRLGQPLLLGQLLLYFRKDSTMTYEDALMYACGIVILNALNTILVNQFVMIAFHNGMKVRVAVCSLIYRKALRLSQTALGETAPGKVVNLLSNDVNRFDWVTVFLNSMWTAPLLTLIVGALLWAEIGYAGMIGIVIVFIVVPIQSYTGKLSSIYRLQTALRTDERVRFMDEVISGVQVIKMYAWEKPFTKLINYARQMELKIVRKSSYVRALYMTFMLFTTRMAIFCTMLAITVLYGSHEITAAKVFVISSYFGIIAHTMSQMFVRGVAEIAEVLVALKRLQNFLELDEKKTQSICAEKNGRNGHVGEKVEFEKIFEVEADHVAPNNVSVSIKNGTASWTMPAVANPLQKGTSKLHKVAPQASDLAPWKPPTLTNINVDFPEGKLIGIIGQVGAGKSSFLQALLRELPLETGSISINGSISYASQEPWVFAGSVRQNILFGQDYDRDRYDAVIKTCALVKDFEQFENGDRTIVGDRGASLSGGQKARLNLARSCYRKADIYLMDDPLSAVDAHVGTHIFNKCIGPKGRLARLNATRILVTHQVHFLKEADWLVILKDGQIEVQGTPADLAKSGVDFAKLVGTNETDIEENPDKFGRQMSRKSSTRSASSSSLNGSTDGSEIDEEEDEGQTQGFELEASSKGKVHGSIAGNYFKAGAHWSILFLLGISFLIVQFLASAADYWVAIWTRQEEMRVYQREHNSTQSNEFDVSDNTVTTPPDTADLSYTLTTEICIYVHGAIMAALFLFAITRSISFYSICVRASQNLHNAMFNGLISTTMRFFDTNPSGRILNRFSKDIGATDEFLPKAMLDATQVILAMFGSIIVAATVNIYFLVPVFVMGFVFIFIRKIYLKTSKNIKRLEGIAKSPVFTHLAATLSGLSTVRAYNAEQILKQEFDNHQNTHSACWYMFAATSSAFGLSLDFMCLIFISCIIFYYMLYDTNISGAEIGLAITQAMSLTGMMQWGIRQSAEISNQLMSVERVLEYRDLEPEKQPKKPRQIADDFPSRGYIEFRNVFYRYFAEAEPVLRGLSFVINPREKIGIVGRTGAGKSSLIGAIFRLACIEGEVLIDDVDTSTLLLKDLRKRVAIIPQDPVLFSGTLRRNLDPFEEYPDDDIWSALEKVELKDVASGPLGLHSAVMAHGSNYSVGQRQLLCLARAILRKNRILVLDEATANVDPQTDLLIQQTIREKFAECTVLTVAHRLHTIIDSDRVLVMDTGYAAEFDEPHKLLQNQTGIFYGMVKALGPQEFNRLSKVAREKFYQVRSTDIEEIRL
ncbi:ATP-binding cassette sub-family C member 4-like [Sitodiplosis mosellana]|uniref:ATP-binding cassette sub-family C member 4-like n=1 Tax=Sitodiplosis mosellana TaxID=263140 RepID=UPI0024452E63|nr:ATP-binding cassette sub-family C member 4-like [Sitodiplosis mosellana]XP_055306705.1 ATP-binding cassette sub-family C member 4-like [Sitodiplosis mosellana]XP_055306711.1 ATP-binding cassette sub-family C member 4-like [Sitodiplosis mosellana]